MRILIDIGHPAHVHLFKNFAWEMIKKGHTILFTCREKEFEIELLESYNFTYQSFGKKFSSLLGKMIGLIYFDFKMFKTCLKFKPDIFLSVGSMYAAQISAIYKKPHIAMEDTGNMEQIRLYLPFTEVVFSPSVLKRNLGGKQIRYDAYHELAYLSPKYFSPDRAVYDFLKIDKKEKYVILRFVSWNATHDVGHGGFSVEHKEAIIKYLSSRYRLFISSESKLSKKYDKFKIKIPPDKMHDVMSFSEFVISEGATMASEAGVLGVPSIYVNSLEACNNIDQEKYGLVFNFKSGDGVLEKIKELEKSIVDKSIYIKRKEKLLNEKIDLTSLLVWFVENYPKSKTILKENSDFQLKFK